MKIRVAPYQQEHIEQVEAFNRRMREGGAHHQFPTRLTSEWLPAIPGRKLYQEYYVALDDQDVVRGGYILKHQDFQVADQVVSIGDFQLPISEGAVNRAYAPIAIRLLGDLMERKEYLYGLGMGGWNEAAARFAKAAGWTLSEVPFFFRVCRPTKFLRNITFLRRSPLRRLILDTAAFTGIGWLGIKAIQGARHKHAARRRTLSVEQIDGFGAWADDLWERCRNNYGMIAIRDTESLQILYPEQNTKFLRLRISENGRLLGWCVLLDTQFTDHKQFGAMRLGSFVDAFASMDDAAVVVDVATSFLERRGVDLIVSNQSHQEWGMALDASGYVRGPSNFLFARSQNLARLMDSLKVDAGSAYLNRGDGDGPIHL